MTVQLSDVRSTPFARLTRIELRKALDTPAGACLLLVVAGTALAGLGWALTRDAGFHDALRGGLFGPQLLLPVIGVFVMAGEWSRRTALTTFTLSPRRGPVLGAQALSVLALSTAVFALVAVLATVIGGTPTDPSAVLGPLVLTTALVVQGIAYGALLQHTAAALVLYFVAPPTWTAASALLLDDPVARWFDVFAAFDALGRLDAVTAPTLTALAVWIGLPLAAGVARGLHRDIS